MASAALIDLCRHACPGLPRGSLPLHTDDAGHESVSLLIDGSHLTIAHEPELGADRARVVVELGRVPRDQEEDALMTALAINQKLYTGVTVSIGRVPDDGSFVLQAAGRLGQFDDRTLQDGLRGLASMARIWREQGFIDDADVAAEWLAQLWPLPDRQSSSESFRALCLAVSEMAGAGEPALPGECTAVELMLRDRRFVLSHGGHTGPDRLLVLATFGPLPAGQEAPAASRLLDLNLSMLGLGGVFARHPSTEDILLKQYLPLDQSTPVELYQSLLVIADAIEDWRGMQFHTAQARRPEPAFL